MYIKSDMPPANSFPSWQGGVYKRGDITLASLQKLQELVREHLEAEEKVLYSVFGAYETKIMGSDTIRNGAFFATNLRLVFYAKRTFGFDMEVYPYENISSFEIGKSLMGQKISFFASGNKVKMKWIQKGDVADFISYVKSRMGKSSSVNNANSSNVQDIPTQITKLAQLVDSGILSQDEFQAKKAEMLARM